MRRGVLAQASFGLWYLVWSATGAAQQVGAPTENLGDLPVEDLLNLKVTSVGRKAQQLAKAPAAVFVITQEDIRRSGATTLMDVLRMVPGLEVARINGSTWAISARGGLSQFANKMLVLIDGRSVYSQFFSGVVWDQQDVALEDIDRIEVIRGPGAVMWGANAVNGVINVITKTAGSTQGTLLSAGSGTEERSFATARYGGAIGDRGFYRIYGKFDERVENKAGTEAVDQSGTPVPQLGQGLWNTGRAGFRVDWDRSSGDSFTVQGDAFRSVEDEAMLIPSLSAPYQVLQQGEERPFGLNLLGRWTHKTSADRESVLQVYYDRVQSSNTLTSYYLDTLDVDFQSRRKWSAQHELYWGLGYRYRESGVADNGPLRLVPDSRGESLLSGVVRDEWQIRPDRWTLSAGVRLEHNDYSGFEVQPSVRLLFTPSHKESFWASWSRAVRTPSRIDSDLQFMASVIPSGPLPVAVFSTGNPAFQSEIVHSYELGYRRQAGQTWSVDAALFYSQIGNLGVYIPQAPVLVPGAAPYIAIQSLEMNQGFGNNSGGEIWATWNIAPKWRLIPGYALLLWNNGCHDCTFPRVLDSRHRVYFRSLLDVSRQWQFDTSVFTASQPGAGFVSNLAPGAVTLGGYVRMDVRLSWRPSRRFEVSATLQDLLHPSRLEFLPTEPYLATAVGRAAVVKLERRF